MVKCMLLQEENIPFNVLEDKKQLFDYVEKYKGYYNQLKYNGVRALVSIKEGKISAIRGRNDIPIFHYFPELKELDFPFKVGLLDCEIVVLDKNGKSNFYTIKKDDKIIQLGIDNRSRSLKDSETIKKYPVTLVVFDVLKIDDELMITKPYDERYKKISLIQESDRIKVVKNYEFKELWDKVLNKDLEGVVIKNPKSLYEIGKRSKENIKIKHYKRAVVKVEETELNEKGVKIFGYLIDDKNVKVKCQIANTENIEIGSEVKIKYLERIGDRLTQPTKL